MREACLILRNHLNDDAKALKSKEVVRACMLFKTSVAYLHSLDAQFKTTEDLLLVPQRF